MSRPGALRQKHTKVVTYSRMLNTSMFCALMTLVQDYMDEAEEHEGPSTLQSDDWAARLKDFHIYVGERRKAGK